MILCARKCNRLRLLRRLCAAEGHAHREKVLRVIDDIDGSPDDAKYQHKQNRVYWENTRPESWHGEAVPPVLMGGDHAKIEAWRRKLAFKRSLERRSDLVEGKSWSMQDLKLLEEIRQEQKK